MESHTWWRLLLGYITQKQLIWMKFSHPILLLIREILIRKWLINLFMEKYDIQCHSCHYYTDYVNVNIWVPRLGDDVLI